MQYPTLHFLYFHNKYIVGIEFLHLLTPWCRVLLEKLTGLQLVKKFPAFHRTRRFITALTSVRHLFLSWARPIQSIYPHPTSWRSILIPSPTYQYVVKLVVSLTIRGGPGVYMNIPVRYIVLLTTRFFDVAKLTSLTPLSFL